MKTLYVYDYKGYSSLVYSPVSPGDEDIRKVIAGALNVYMFSTEGKDVKIEKFNGKDWKVLFDSSVAHDCKG